MTLPDLCSAIEALQFPAAHEQRRPELAQVRAARSAVEAAIVDDEFLSDCLAAELRMLESGRVRRSLTAFATLPQSGIRLAFGYWRPGGAALVHEHAGWTITAVCRNELTVQTYDRAQSYLRRTLVPKNQFHAQAGKAGFIFEPCIHQPRNTSLHWSLSLHVIGPHDDAPAVDQPEPLAALEVKPQVARARNNHPFSSVEAVRQRRAYARALGHIVGSIGGAQASALRRRCDALGTPSEDPRRLARVHDELDLTCRESGDMVALDVDTPDGRCEAFAINDVARAAIQFVAAERIFNVDALPGNLSAAERAAIARALEESGLFRRVTS